MISNRPTIVAVSVLQNVALACLLVVASTNASAAIEVCGTIDNGARWSIEDSPVVVTCDLSVAGLTIDPGVEVQIAGEFQINVSGLIHALGTREQPVIFKPTEDNLTGWVGFYFEDATPGSEFVWSEIEGATSSGAHLVRSTPTFDHVTFRNNSATLGGAIRVELLSGDLQINDCRFVDNFASSAGGAIYATGPTGAGDATLEVTGSVFQNNNAGTTSTRANTAGGGIYVNGNSRIQRSAFIENEVRAYTIFVQPGRFTRGGAIYAAGGFHDVTATTFIANACRMGSHSQTPDPSRTHGGALHLASGELTLSNSLLALNSLLPGRNPDRRGAGIYIAGGMASIVNTTLADNSHHAVYRNSGQVDILNSILFFNNGSGTQIAGTVMATYSDIQNGFDGEGNISLNPIFNEQFAIVPPSPAIDAGNPSPQYNDLIPPGLGTVRNDMGHLGGPFAIFSALANAGPDQEVDERTTATLDGTGSVDRDGGALTYSWRQVSGPPVVLSDVTAAQPTFDAFEVSGPTPLVFELVVNDGMFDSNPDTVTVTIIHVNRVPTADAGPDQVVEERSTVTLDGAGSSDPDGDILNHLWTQTSGPTAVLSSASDASPTFVAPDVEQSTLLEFELVVSDGLAESDVDTVTVTVTHVNRAPVADAGEDQGVGEREAVTLNGTASADPDGDPITYFWSQSSGPAVTLSDPTAVQPSFTAPEVTTAVSLTFDLVVNDGILDSAIDVVEISVNHVNQVPTADAGPGQLVDERTGVTLDGTSSVDLDNDPLTYSWTQTVGIGVTLSDPSSTLR